METRSTKYLLVLKYREKYLKYLETWVVLLLHSFAIIYIKYLSLAPSWIEVWLNWSIYEIEIGVNSTIKDQMLTEFNKR